MARMSPACAESSIANPTMLSDLFITIHPLPILNISDHHTRHQFTSQSATSNIYGALIGTQTGRKLEIVNSFEVPVDQDEKVDFGFFKTRQEQFQQVFPTLSLLGWYSLGQEPTKQHLNIQTQFNQYTDLSAPILLLYHPSSFSLEDSNIKRELPLALYEFISLGSVENVYLKCAYDIQTSEAERIAVDYVTKPNVGGKENGLLANLITQRNAIKMLHSKLGVIVSYLQQFNSPEQTNSEALQSKFDHELLRELSSLVTCLPNPTENPFFKNEFMTESNDGLLTSYLSAQSKTLNQTNQLIDRYLYITGREVDSSKISNSNKSQDLLKGKTLLSLETMLSNSSSFKTFLNSSNPGNKKR
ncbi:hypothetical protein O181_030341 [Austropuccinia psidii MF-1]|uniref:COP9 signalosome complex subunit 6 n=1 Tax=Austropuccinia psidii MF-1 TaxID=1389203 RepID=A0A9Q3CYB1_9BASI|nr:hypothetical protein [Austropuccinia psidii MF-1]